MHDDPLAEAMPPIDARAAPPDAQARLATGPLLVLLAWCLAFLAIRLLEHGTLERDEAEIVYLTQHLRLGYGTQPPLYAWLQWLFFEAFGIDRFSLLILKTLALGSTCLAMFQVSRGLLGRRGAMAVTASLALFLQVGWEALRIQTHSVLMTAIACATLWLYFALLRRPTLARYVGFGVLCGLGLQTKYNYGVFLGGVLGASLLVRAHREALWTRKAWAAVLPAVLLVLPHAAWVATHADLAFAGTVRKMQDGAADAPYVARAAYGFVGVLKALVSFVALPALVYAAVCWRRRRLWQGQAWFDRIDPASRFFASLYALCGLLLAVLALTGEVGTIKERWMIPLFFSLPLGLFVMVPALGRDEIYRDLTRVAGVVALCLLAMLPLRTWLGHYFGKDMTRNHPYAALSAAVAQRCPAARTVVTESLLTVGNLRFARPALATVLLEDAQRERPPLNGPAALVTHAQAAPDALPAFHALWPNARLAPGLDLALAVEDGSGRRMGFMVACVAPGPALEDELR
jgi:4-amino-4-deoxy-L-arabinose transferase-like glycosyltransferase